jgi:hypothetical protein
MQYKHGPDTINIYLINALTLSSNIRIGYTIVLFRLEFLQVKVCMQDIFYRAFMLTTRLTQSMIHDLCTRTIFFWREQSMKT